MTTNIPPGLATHDLSPAEVTAAIHTMAVSLEALAILLDRELPVRCAGTLEAVRLTMAGMRGELGLLSSTERGFSEN